MAFVGQAVPQTPQPLHKATITCDASFSPLGNISMAPYAHKCSKSLHPLHKSSVTFATIPYASSGDFERAVVAIEAAMHLPMHFCRVRFNVFFDYPRILCLPVK
jgi:hypothetical protein